LLFHQRKSCTFPTNRFISTPSERAAMRERLHYITADDGTRIECAVIEHDHPHATTSESVSSTSRARDWFVLAHAHPKLGGSREMMTPLARALARKGYGSVSIALRGTSGSLGHSSWRGSPEEGADIIAGARLARKCFGATTETRVHLIGYSYGSTICSYALDGDESIASFIAIGYPRGSYSCGFMGIGAKILMRDSFDALKASRKPKLFIHPANDDFTSQSTMERLVSEKLSNEGMDGAESGSVKPCLKILPGAGHFSVVNDSCAVEDAASMIVDFVEKLEL
jgi:uncharacterized protein